jgi:transposase-like protein
VQHLAGSLSCSHTSDALRLDELKQRMKYLEMHSIDHRNNIPGEFHLLAVANTAARLVPRVQKHVAVGSTVNTDSLRSYRTLGKKGYTHAAVNHENHQWAIGIHSTNSIEGFWSHLKRGISSTHCAVSPNYLQNYVDEFSFRFNNRHEPAQMFQRMFKQVSNT